MSKINLNEMMALYQVLNFVDIKTLLTSSMRALSEGETTKDKENADLIYKTIKTFL